MSTPTEFQADVIARLARIETHGEAAAEFVRDHETRLRVVERRQWLFAGAAMALQPVLAKLGIHLPGLS
jgi:hypothetical protein